MQGPLLDHFRRLNVPVIDLTALFAGPDPVRQLQISFDPATVGHAAGFREASNLENGFSIPVRFILTELNQSAPSGIGNLPGKLMIFEHSRNVQGLERQSLVFADQARRELLKEAFADGGNPFMNAGDFEALFVSVL
jgi:hypothetical protein